MAPLPIITECYLSTVVNVLLHTWDEEMRVTTSSWVVLHEYCCKWHDQIPHLSLGGQRKYDFSFYFFMQLIVTKGPKPKTQSNKIQIPKNNMIHHKVTNMKKDGSWYLLGQTNEKCYEWVLYTIDQSHSIIWTLLIDGLVHREETNHRRRCGLLFSMVIVSNTIFNYYSLFERKRQYIYSFYFIHWCYHARDVQ